MISDAAIVVGIIGAVFAGVLGLVKVFMPYLRKSPAPAVAHEIPAPRPAMPTAADASGAYIASGSPDYGDLPDTGQTMYATRNDLDRFSTTVNKRFDKFEESQRTETVKLEERIDSNAKETREVLMDLTRTIGQLEGTKK